MAHLHSGSGPSFRSVRRLGRLLRRFSRDKRGGSAIWPQDARGAGIAAACIAAILAIVVLGKALG